MPESSAVQQGPQTILVRLLQLCKLSRADAAREVGACPPTGLHHVLPSERLQEILSLLQFAPCLETQFGDSSQSPHFLTLIFPQSFHFQLFFKLVPFLLYVSVILLGAALLTLPCWPRLSHPTLFFRGHEEMPSKKSILFQRFLWRTVTTFDLGSSTGWSTGTEKVDEWGGFPFPLENLRFCIFTCCQN